MIDYENVTQRIINSIIEFSFEYDFEIVKKKMELQEISKEELEKLGENQVRENFNKGIFKIKLPNGDLIDAATIAKYSIENKIKQPVIFINPNFKYVQWVLRKDFTTPQIKRRIRNLLISNSDINLDEVQKTLLVEDLKNKEIEGYLDELPIKVSNYVNEGKFYIQSSCSRESAIEMINEVIEELKVDANEYVKSKIKRDRRNIFIYVLFVVVICLLWFVNKQFNQLPSMLSNSIGLILFLTPLVIMRLINHSIFDTLFFKTKVQKKYEKEFHNKRS